MNKELIISKEDEINKIDMIFYSLMKEFIELYSRDYICSSEDFISKIYKIYKFFNLSTTQFPIQILHLLSEKRIGNCQILCNYLLTSFNEILKKINGNEIENDKEIKIENNEKFIFNLFGLLQLNGEFDYLIDGDKVISRFLDDLQFKNFNFIFEDFENEIVKNEFLLKIKNEANKKKENESKIDE
jgi:hypothetical protein